METKKKYGTFTKSAIKNKFDWAWTYVIISISIVSILNIGLIKFLNIDSEIKTFSYVTIDVFFMIIRIFLLILFLKVRNIRLKSILGKFTLVKGSIKWCILYIVLNLSIINVLIYFGLDIPTDLILNSKLSLYFISYITFVVPLFEEFLFRGLLYNSLAENFNKKIAFLLIGFVFSLTHGVVGLLFLVTGSGFLETYVYAKSKSLWSSIFIHVLHNLIISLFLIYSFIYPFNNEKNSLG